MTRWPRLLLRGFVASGLVVAATAACRLAPAPPPSVEPTKAPVPTATSTPTVTPWLLVDQAASPEVQNEVSAWAGTTGLDVRAGPLGEMLGGPPAGLWAVVGEEPGLQSLHERWAGEDVVFVVLEPRSMSADERTSTLGPGVKHDQTGFLAGVAAGLATQNWDVGVLPGDSSESSSAFLSGFTQGLLYSCPRCRLDSVADVTQPPFGIDVIGVPPSVDLSAVALGPSAPWLVVTGRGAPEGWSERVAARVRPAPEAIVGKALDRLWKGAAGEAWDFAADDASLRTEVNADAISPGRERLLRDTEQRLAEGVLVVFDGA